MPNNKCKTVVIVGAGAAGIAAANKLANDPNVKVTILEASNKIGGRVREDDLGQFKIDHGAQWIHGEEGNVAFQIADKLGIADDDNVSL